VSVILACKYLHLANVPNSEQLIPMFGLSKLMHVVDPETTVDKFLFLLQNAFTKSNPLTTTISFSALFTLIALRVVKNRFKGIWWIYRIPEVLVVVLVSTCAFSHSSFENSQFLLFISSPLF